MNNDTNKEPVERYLQLDPKVREFLESMDEEDVETAKNLMKTYRNAGVVTQFMKWIIILAFTLFMGIAGIFEKVSKLFWTKAGV